MGGEIGEQRENAEEERRDSDPQPAWTLNDIAANLKTSDLKPQFNMHCPHFAWQDCCPMPFITHRLFLLISPRWPGPVPAER